MDSLDVSLRGHTSQCPEPEPGTGDFREALQMVTGTTSTLISQLDLHLQQTCDPQTKLWSNQGDTLSCGGLLLG